MHQICLSKRLGSRGASDWENVVPFNGQQVKKKEEIIQGHNEGHDIQPQAEQEEQLPEEDPMQREIYIGLASNDGKGVR